MHIYLVRHAHAVPGFNDAVRPLSVEGIAQVKAVSRLLRKTGAIQAQQLWHSPLVRSRETTERMAKRLYLKARQCQIDGLLPADDPLILAQRLCAQKDPVMVVGHEPNLTAVATLLVTGRTGSRRFVLKKCAVLRLDREDSHWIVRWQVSPELVG